jgi:hypothetical protein
MSFTVEQKNLLTKLMASENLTVEHQKIHTAKFDPINRVLYLPIWQDMSGFMYDHLGGHEVGHALYTPADGWHDAAVDKTKNKNYKSFLNVVEDARIEKKVTRKFPGLKTSFKKGFQELLDRDFFGIKYKDVNKLAFIERLNLYTKSQYTADYIKFTTQEMVYVTKVQNLETWDDVLALTGEIYDYSKDEQFDMHMEQQMRDFEMFNSDDDTDTDSNSDSDYEYSEEEDETGEPQDSDDSEKSDEKSEKQTEESGDVDADSDDTEEEEDTEETESETINELDRYKESVESQRDQFTPECSTDDSYRQNENSLLDAKCKPYLYVDVPTVNAKNVFTSAKRVHELLTIGFDEQIEGGYFDNAYVQGLVNDFKNKNDRYIGLLAKEFEMRKAAKAFSKSKLSDTGDIDINKLSNYKFDDNIFRKVMMIPKGKSHGLVLLLDCSGSMSENMEGSIEQILVLSLFCRKVNIPFRVFGFTDCISTYKFDRNLDLDAYNEDISFSNNAGELGFSNVQLREYLNSKMSNTEFTKCLRNMILLKQSYSVIRYQNRVRRPASENLSNTPLVQAVFAIGSIMDNFRKSNNVDLTSLIIVHDGDADNASSHYVEVDHKDYNGKMIKKVWSYSFDLRTYNVIVRDRKNKFQYVMKQNPEKSYSHYTNEELLRAALEWVRVVGKSKVFGFFILGSRYSVSKNSIRNRYFFDDGKSLADLRKENAFGYFDTEKNLLKKFKNDKFLISNTVGYNSFYLISGGSDLQTEEEQLEITGTVTSNKLKNAFMKMTKKKQVNRVLVSKFIQGMAV